MRKNQAGFTLVELLAAMVAGSFILATLSWTLASLGRELRISGQAEPGQRLAAAAPILADLIEQARPAMVGEARIAAEPGRLEFVTAPPAALGAAGPVRVALSVRSQAGGDALVARFEPADAGAAFPADARTDRVVAQGYRSIRFDYVMPAGMDEGQPPRLVTISFSDREGRTARITAAPRLTAPGDCRFDPVSMTCRR